MTDIEKVIDRVRKLWAKAESCKAIGSTAEAESFAEAAQKTLAKYKLDMSVLSVEEQEYESPMGRTHVSGLTGRVKQKREAWVESLAEGVCRAYFCKIVVIPGSNTFIIVGREQDRAVAEYVIATLVRECKDTATKASRRERHRAWKEGSTSDAAGFHTAFVSGFVHRVRERLKELRAEMEKPSSGMALMVRQSDEEVQAYMKSWVRKGTGITGRSSSNLDGYREGRAHGDRANISGRAVKGGEEKAGRNLRAPTKQLNPGS